MTTNLRSITTQALGLTLDERAELAETLLTSIEPPEPLSPEWEAEIERRIAAADAGEVEYIPADEVLAKVRALIESHPDYARKT